MSATTHPLAHVLPAGARVDEAGHLEIGGCDAVALAREYGTPAYVVVEPDLRARARAFREGLTARREGGEVVFATKAFPCTAVLRALAEEGLGADVASGGELALALHAGVAPARILLHGNAKSDAEIEQALDAGIGRVVLDSRDDLERTARHAAARGLVQDVLLRVTPDVAGETHAAISTGQADSKFGFSTDAARAAIDRLADAPALRMRGLHAHIGSQLAALEPFRDAVRALAALGEFPELDIGGGLGVAYRAEEHPPAIDTYLDAVCAAVREHCGSGTRLLLEPGRCLVAPSTVTLYTVQTVKRNVSRWVAVDGGMSDNLRPMLYGAGYEALVADRAGEVPDTVCHLAGKHCESGDVIVRDAHLAAPTVGDVIAVPATGAYGHAMANNYNGVPRPPVVFCGEGRARLVVRRERYDDLLARDLA